MVSYSELPFRLLVIFFLISVSIKNKRFENMGVNYALLKCTVASYFL